MADEFRFTLPAGMWIGDENGIVDAGDNPSTPDAPSGRSSGKFPDGSDESAMVSQSFSIPSSDIWTSGSGAKLKIYYFGDAAGGGNAVRLEAAFECITESDAHDLHAGADFFAAVQGVTDTVDAAAGEECVAEISFTQAQADAIEPGDSCRLVIRRDSDLAGDNYADAIWIKQVDLLEVVA